MGKNKTNNPVQCNSTITNQLWPIVLHLQTKKLNAILETIKEPHHQLIETRLLDTVVGNYIIVKVATGTLHNTGHRGRWQGRADWGD